MKSIHIKDFCEQPGNSQQTAADLLDLHQTAISKMIRRGRPVYLIFDNRDRFLRAVERQERTVGKKAKG